MRIEQLKTDKKVLLEKLNDFLLFFHFEIFGLIKTGCQVNTKNLITKIKQTLIFKFGLGSNILLGEV